MVLTLIAKGTQDLKTQNYSNSSSSIIGLGFKLSITNFASFLSSSISIAKGFDFANFTKSASCNNALSLSMVSLDVDIAEPPAPIGLVINEFVANNEDSLEDEDLDNPDWIELYNGQDQNQNLSGYYLTNDPSQETLWRLPSVIMSPFDHFVIFASGKDRSSPDSSLHTNFNLSKEGGYLALIAPDGITVVSEFNYLEQVQDISYGALGNNRSVGYLENPNKPLFFE